MPQEYYSGGGASGLTDFFHEGGAATACTVAGDVSELLHGMDIKATRDARKLLANGLNRALNARLTTLQKGSTLTARALGTRL
jgi:hypothetical protein